MFAFGETVERLPKDFAADRARIKKGKVFGRKRSLDLTQAVDSLMLPDITTTQLTQNCETTGVSRKEAREGMNGKERKPVHQIAKRGRLRDSTFMIEDNVGSRVEELEGLLVSKLNFQSESTELSQENFSFGCAKKQRKHHSRLSKTDSGFYEDSGDDLVTRSVPGSPNDSDKASNVLNGSVGPVTTPAEKTRKLTLDFKTILNQNKAVVRNTEKLTARANMRCVQSTPSLHADLVAFKSLSTHYKGGAISNCTLQTNEHCVKLREVVLKTRTNAYDDGLKQSDTTLAVLKTRRRLLGRRNSTCPTFPFTQRRNKERVVDFSRASCGDKHRIQFANEERLDNKPCVSCPVDLSASKNEVRNTSGNENPITDLNCAGSTSNLTGKASLEATGSQETADVNAKCQEWLSRWIAFTDHAPQLVMDSLTVPLENFKEST